MRMDVLLSDSPHDVVLLRILLKEQGPGGWLLLGRDSCRAAGCEPADCSHLVASQPVAGGPNTPFAAGTLC
jgi:hypothetical protein